MAACNESLDSSGGCPLVCANSQAQIQTVVLNGIALDMTVPADLGLGSESEMLLSNRGDTLDTRVIVRFDSLPIVANTNSSSTAPITSVDSVYLHFWIDTSLAGPGVPVTIEAYDVDTSATNDTSVATLTALFTPGRFLGAKTFTAGTYPDTAIIALPNATILSKLQARQRLRIGLRIVPSQSSATARIYSTTDPRGRSPHLTMRVRQSTDTLSTYVYLYPLSTTPADNKTVSSNLADFTLTVIGTPVPTGAYLAVGGLPVSRTYLRFNLPSMIVDSAIIVRATLVLTQVPGAIPDQADTMLIQPNIVLAGSIIDDPARAAQIISTAVARTEPLVTHPMDAGIKEIEIAPIFPYWALQNEANYPRAIVLHSGAEVLSPQQSLFWSSEAPDTANRPKLRISYTLRSRIGTP